MVYAGRGEKLNGHLMDRCAANALFVQKKQEIWAKAHETHESQ